jgi:signal transduction histidine kinase
MQMPYRQELGPLSQGVEPRCDARELQQRLAFLEMTPQDAAQLRALAPMFQKHLAEFAEAFYGHLFAFEATSKFLQDPMQVERLKAMQRAHFESMLEAEWDEAYVQGRRQVGHVHAEVGIEPQWFLGAFNQYAQHCFRRFAESQGHPMEGEFAWMGSFVKSLLFDIGLTLDAYFWQSMSNLRNALDMLWKANQELRQFAQLTTHDLKTPLATVANLCDEALDEFGDQMPAEARKLIEAARQGTFRMSGLIDELLSTAMTAQATEGSQEISLGEIVNQALERVRPVLKERNVELLMDSDWPTTWGNLVRIREAVYNILSNAAKFIDKTPGRIEIRAETSETSCLLKIRDNGPGIPADELNRIFVPFRRLPVHRDQMGHGLGLYFTKQLIEGLGGRVWVESEPGSGSCFYVELRRPPGEKPRGPKRPE